MSKNKEPIDVCDFCCKWYNDHVNSSPATIAESYVEMIIVVLKEKFGIDKKAAKQFVEDACCGNWDRLHLTKAEHTIDAQMWADMLLSEVWYSSDRWSWDRLLRIQWLYRRLFDTCRGVWE